MQHPSLASTAGTPGWPDRLQEALTTSGTAAVLGLDPNPDRIEGLDRGTPEQMAKGVQAWCLDILEQTAGIFGVIKLQSAWFELHGSAGVAAMEEVSRRARNDFKLLVIADVKRGDIGISSEAYAKAWIGGDAPRADAMTMAPWMGPDSLAPCCQVAADCDTGVFVCAHTSNAGANWLQSLPTEEEIPMWQQIAGTVHQLSPPNSGSYSSMGLVVGANRPDTARIVREHYPGLWMLAPGLGAQGASLDRIADFLDEAGTGALFPNSRAITFPARGSVRDAAQRFVDDLQQAIETR